MSAIVVARRVASTPTRSAIETWLLITDLIAPGGRAGRADLEAVAGIAASLVASESTRDAPIVVCGVGPRLRVYTVHDEQAILGEGLSEDPLSWSPTEGEWAMSLPCSKEDLPWVRPALTAISTRVTVRDLSEPVADNAESDPSVSEAGDATVDLEAFLRP